MDIFPPRRTRFLVSLVVVLEFISGHFSYAKESSWPAVEREAVLKRLATSEKIWTEKISTDHPRLFFRKLDDNFLAQRFQNPDRVQKALLQRINDQVGLLISQPTPSYRPPESFVGHGETKYSADNELWERPVGDSIVLLSFALALHDNEAIRQKLHDTVLAACGFPTWGRNPDNMDLPCAHIAKGIAIAYDWHSKLWSTDERACIRSTVQQRIRQLTAGLYGAHYWSRNYNENHNHVDVAGIGLCGLAFYGEIPEAAEWLSAALTDYDYVMRYSYADGSSDEGVPYWTYSVGYILIFLEGLKPTLGDEFYRAAFLKNAISFRLNASTPGFAGTLPWGDGPNRDYYGPQHILYRLASQYRDAAGQYLANHIPYPPQGDGDVSVWTLLWYDPSLQETPPREFDHHNSINDIVTTRSGWDSGDYLLTIKSGPTNRNHSHLDAGAIAFSFGGEWLIRAPGYGSGATNADFWNSTGPRWNYFSNATESHSTLLIGGRNQSIAHEARSAVEHFLSSPSWCFTEINLSGAYEGIESARRLVVHRRGEYILVADEVAAAKPVQVESLVQVPPNAASSGKSIDVASRAGKLTVRLLSPDSAFYLRTPKSVHVDVFPGKFKTLAAAATGIKEREAILLLPTFSNQPSPVQTDSIEESVPAAFYRISGSTWDDVVVTSSGANPLVLSPREEFRRGQDTFVSTDGIAAAVRFNQDGMESVVALGARFFRAAEIAVDAHTSTDFALQRIGPHAWILDLSTPFARNDPSLYSRPNYTRFRLRRNRSRRSFFTRKFGGGALYLLRRRRTSRSRGALALCNEHDSKYSAADSYPARFSAATIIDGAAHRGRGFQI